MPGSFLPSSLSFDLSFNMGFGNHTQVLLFPQQTFYQLRLSTDQMAPSVTIKHFNRVPASGILSFFASPVHLVKKREGGEITGEVAGLGLHCSREPL